jgi:hypothetical protein
VGLEVEGFAGANGAEVGFLDEVLRALRVARQTPRDPVQRVELFQRELLELFTRRFQINTPD